MHPLASAPHSFKELLTHIGIVTIGILIALSLEGMIEVLHDRHLVHDARENFRLEIHADQQNMDLELKNVNQLHQAIQQVIVDLPLLAHDPAELRARVDKLRPSLYYLSSNSWASALSSGALAHMDSDEVNRYTIFDLTVRSYGSMEDRALTQMYDVRSYVDSHQTFDPAALQETEQRLRAYEMLTETMAHVGNQVGDAFSKALPN